MIHSLRLKNFYSFKDEQEISLIVEKKPGKKSGSYVKAENADYFVTKLLTAVGPNASGKTNVLKAFGFIDWFISLSFVENKSGDELPLLPFLFTGKIEPTELEIVFDVSGRIYRYEIELTRSEVIFERLSHKTSAKFSLVFERRLNEKKEYNFKNNADFVFPPKFSDQRNNASIIAMAAQYGHRDSVEIQKYWMDAMANVTEEGYAASDSKKSLRQHIAATLEKDQELKKKVMSEMRRFDVGLNNIDFRDIQVEVKGEQKKVSRLFGMHDFGGRSYGIPFDYESSGTQSLLEILALIHLALKSGAPVVLDEIENQLHPHVLSELLHYFVSPQSNPNNAQLILSTHSVQILRQLDREQILLVEKNEAGTSEAYRLDSVKGVSRQEDYFRKYDSGTYGATPHIQ